MMGKRIATRGELGWERESTVPLTGGGFILRLRGGLGAVGGTSVTVLNAQLQHREFNSAVRESASRDSDRYSLRLC